MWTFEGQLVVAVLRRAGGERVEQATTDAAAAVGGVTATTSSGTCTPSGVMTGGGFRKCHQAAPIG